jgi:hypothetical protein
MFDAVQVDSYLHRHVCLLISQIQARTRAARAGSAWNSSKQVPADPGAVDPGTANYCARAVTFRSEEVTLQVEDQPDRFRFLPDP